MFDKEIIRSFLMRENYDVKEHDECLTMYFWLALSIFNFYVAVLLAALCLSVFPIYACNSKTKNVPQGTCKWSASFQFKWSKDSPDVKNLKKLLHI